MPSNQRRKFLKLTAGTLGASAAVSILPAVIRNALATPAANVTGTINALAHIAIFIQENRCFGS